MPLFDYEQLENLLESELRVYSYVTAHLNEASDMSIRQLSEAVGVSTTTILRFCTKTGCDGFQELKYRLKRYQEAERTLNWQYPQDYQQVAAFLNSLAQNTDMKGKMRQAAQWIASAREVHFVGVGTSGCLSSYGARYFANLRLPATIVPDPFYPKPVRDMDKELLIALSTSGETEETIIQANDYKLVHAKVISITNTSACRLANISDLNLNYYMPAFYAPSQMGPHNLTTQLPVIYLLETLARQAASLKYSKQKTQ